MMLTVGSFFSGIGGLEEGFHRAGCEIVFQVEKDPACLNILRRHYPNAVRYPDVTEVTYDRLREDLGARADVDVVLGGWPCQDVSLAGHRAGLAGHRSGLFFEFRRLVAEIGPRWVVAENVPGLLSSFSPVGDPADGVEVRPGVREVDETSDLGVVLASMAELGYGCPAASDEAWEDDAAGAAGGAGEDRSERGPDPAGTRRVRAGAIVSALTSSDGGVDFDMAEAGHLVPQPAEFIVGSEWDDQLARPLTAVENGMRYDFETETWIGNLEADLELATDPPGDDSQRAFNIHGEHSTAMTSEHGVSEVGYPTEVSRSIDTRPGGSMNQGQTVIVVPADRLGDGSVQHPDAGRYSLHNGEEALVAEGVTHPITAAGGPKGQQVLVTDAEPVAYRKSTRAHDADDGETWVDDDIANTLTRHEFSPARTTHAVVQAEGPVHPVDLRLSTRTGTDTGEGTPGNGWGEDGDPSGPVYGRPPPAVSQELTVRRLTPLECERLQGFEDGWTAWGVDAAGARVEQFDSTRYKQLGNAVAVVCSTWIARRLIGVDQKTRSAA